VAVWLTTTNDNYHYHKQRDDKQGYHKQGYDKVADDNHGYDKQSYNDAADSKPGGRNPF